MSIKRVSLRMEEELHQALKYIALEDDMTLQDIFIQAVEDKYSTRILERKMKGEQ